MRPAEGSTGAGVDTGLSPSGSAWIWLSARVAVVLSFGMGSERRRPCGCSVGSAGTVSDRRGAIKAAGAEGSAPLVGTPEPDLVKVNEASRGLLFVGWRASWRWRRSLADFNEAISRLNCEG